MAQALWTWGTRLNKISVMPSRLTCYDVPGHTHLWAISCFRRLSFFWHDAMKQVVIDALDMLRGRFAVCLVGYVIMPEHVHVMIYPHPKGRDQPMSISKLLHAFKRHVGFHGKAALREILKQGIVGDTI